mmetsp:Transcript_1493/g.3159  ORF Transcript_1493/g.3159 Transcript_1493/m.3159 type:complete len:208 (-) Transcript_1493:214-837(-)|eukprot:CAMPEP_0172320078 /NCGR_PEP_ID=MMETSP1058-20130122/39546_1 /TAXON_ID=83371 /ORGANISM="Detonula confervacea, Strain CCMP 353" /LENGTH=207 /DNA_ID=CAMNT_0013035267 /DNA_START=34 /DNA_END=657 /DNA_ORIENTATION=+
MEVLKSGNVPALVSNLEVMQLLRERMDARQSQDISGGVGSSAGGNNTTGDDNVIIKTPFQNRDWIEQAVLSHLQSTPAGEVADDKLEDTPKLVEQLRRDPTSTASIVSTTVKAEDMDVDDDRQPSGYGLTNAETLQILNHLPTSPVEVHLLIEDLEKREHLDDAEKQLKLLRLVSQFSGRPVEDGGGDEDENEGEEDGDQEDNEENE